MKADKGQNKMSMRSLFLCRPARSIAVVLALTLSGLAMAGCSSRAERAQAYYERGKAYLEQKDYVKARLEMRNALQRKPDLLEAWKALAEIDEHEQNLQGLVGDLRRVVEIDDKDLEATQKLARLYLLGNALDPALKLADKADALAPKNADVIALKAAVLFKLKDNDGAARTAQEALAIEPANTGANMILAGVKSAQGDIASALKIFANVPKEHEDDLGVVFLKVNLFTQQGNVAEAEKLLRRLIELNPKIPQFRTELVQFYLRNKQPDKAIAELRAAAAANTADTAAELQLVSLLAATQGPAAARAELVARVDSGKDAFPYQIALAKFDFSQGKADDAIKQLEQLIANASSPENGLTAKVTLAEIHAARNNIAAAEALVTDILKADSHNTAGLRLRAGISLERGKVDDAIADLRTALNDQPRSPELLAALAIAYERNGSIELAERSFFDATKASNYNTTIGLNYVAFLRRRGMGAQAETVLNDLASRNGSSIPVLATLAQVKLEHQDWVGAHAVADVIQKLGDKGNVASQINAAAFSGQGKFSDSLAILQNAYQANPGAVRPMVDLVNVYMRSGQTAQAESFVRSVLKDNPNNAEALVLLGSIQMVKNTPADAERSFRSAIEKKPDDVAGYRALADLYVRQRKTDEAETVVREGLKREPNSFALQLVDAGLKENKGDFEGAISEYDAMLKAQPTSLIVANNLASLLADHRTDKASLDRADQLATMLKSSQVPQFKDTLGWVSYQRQDYRAALPLLQDAAKALPKLAMVHFHLGMAYLATGQDEKAGDEFNQARTLAPKDAELAAKIDAALKRRPAKAKG